MLIPKETVVGITDWNSAGLNNGYVWDLLIHLQHLHLHQPARSIWLWY
jgi:hypothetical protein